MIKVFWHIFATNHWYSIVSEQTRILLTSGLYDACEEINIGLIALPEERAKLERYFIDVYPKLHIRYCSSHPEDFEFRTLKLIESDGSDYTGLYFHAKGVTKPSATDVAHWTAFLNEEILNLWRGHHHNIINGYDVSSVNFLKSPDHFSGNYWWFNRRYIDTLPRIGDLDLTNRWHAEQWIAMGKGKLFYPPFREPGKTSFLMKYK